jgi:prophage regulatory protein
MKLNEFPQAIKLGLRSVGWAEHEVEAWLQERIQLRDGLLHR